ncbi:MAG: hypothetical protein GF334_11525 [Candidatus Altiarchaeales archaeon]|nr:hypothetical protein [Candidatus Altiarchaeales archaeon]
MSLSQELLDFMNKWTGSSGKLLFVNEVKKLGLGDIDNLDEKDKSQLMNCLCHDVLATFLSTRRYRFARAELASIFGFHEDDYHIHDLKRSRLQKPPLF